MIRPPFVLLLAATLVPVAAPADEARPAKPAGGFLLADVNGDGRVTADELETFLTARFSALDADSDGRIAVGELPRPGDEDRRGPPPGGFRGPPPGGHHGPGGPPPEGRPHGPPPPHHGAGPDGTSPGGPPRMGEGFPFPRPEDADEDGFISRAEFVAPAAAMIDYWDRNHDGAVTADEAPSSFRPQPSDDPR